MFYDTVQKSIDDCKNDGANYVVLMSHCGYGDEYGEYGSVPLMENVSGWPLDMVVWRLFLCDYLIFQTVSNFRFEYS